MKKIEPVTDNSYADEVITLYRSFWDKAWEGHKNIQICNFEGNLEDLEMLAYCEYELGFPENGYKNAAIIWGNVIKKQTNLILG